jgi:hypothetical protein
MRPSISEAAFYDLICMKTDEINSEEMSDERREYLHGEIARIVVNYEDSKENKIFVEGLSRGVRKAYEEAARNRKITRKSVKKTRKSLPCLENMAELRVRGKTSTESYNN